MKSSVDLVSPHFAYCSFFSLGFFRRRRRRRLLLPIFLFPLFFLLFCSFFSVYSFRLSPVLPFPLPLRRRHYYRLGLYIEVCVGGISCFIYRNPTKSPNPSTRPTGPSASPAPSVYFQDPSSLRRPLPRRSQCPQLVIAWDTS